MKLKTGLRYKITLLILFSTFIIAFVGIATGYFLGYRLMKDTIGVSNVKIAGNLARLISKVMDSEVSDITLYMSNPVHLEAIEEANSRYSSLNSEDEEKKFPLNSDWVFSASSEKLKAYSAANNTIADIFLTDKSGGIVSASGRIAEVYQADEQWWKEAYDEGRGKIYISDIEFDESSGAKWITLAIPLRNADEEVIGICKVFLKPEVLFSAVDTLKVGNTGHGSLINEKGEILYHAGEDSLGRKAFRKEQIRDIIESSPGWAITEGSPIHGDKEIFAASAVIEHPVLSEKGLGWRIFFTQDVNEVFAPVNKIFFQIFIITGVLILFLMPGGYIYGNILVTPIRKLQEAVERIAKGELDYPIEIKTNDEIASLARTFKEMMFALKRKQEELLESKHHAENIFSSLIDTVVVFDKKAEIKSVNRAACDLLGYEEEELIGHDAGLIFSEGTDLRTEWLEKIVADEKISDKTLEYKTKYGEKILVSFSGSVLRDKSGQFTGIVGVARDMRPTMKLISELERAKAELEEWNKTLEKKVQERTLDLKRNQESTLHILSDLQISKDELEVKTRKLDEALEETRRSRDIMVSMLEDNHKARKELEEKLKELKNAQELIIENEKLASIGKLVADMAHEVNNPLMIVSGRAQLSLMEESTEEEKKENLRIIMDQCMRAKEITQRLLAFSRQGVGIVTEVRIEEVIGFVVKLMEHQFKLINIEIKQFYDKDLPSIKIDEKQMHEVFMNLIKNSAEAMPKGGTITIRAKEEKDNILVEIGDTGEGIPEEVMKKIFDPFFTTKKTGTGLGVSVCYGIITDHGGQLKYTSSPGKGTVATISLPLFPTGGYDV